MLENFISIPAVTNLTECKCAEKRCFCFSEISLWELTVFDSCKVASIK